VPRYDALVSIWEGEPNIRRLWSLWQEFKENTDDYSHNEPLYDFEEVFYAALAQDVYPEVEILVIDELHDAYPAMFKLLEMWAEKVQEDGGTVIVAGDEYQVINRHQGADAQYFQDFDLPEIHLPVSYRVPEEHWVLAKAIISRSFETPDIRAANSGGNLEVRTSPEFKWRAGPVVPRERGTPSDLLDDVPDWVIDDYVDEYGMRGDSEGVMFLTRTRRQAYCLAMDLRREGVLFTGSGGTGAWSWARPRPASGCTTSYRSSSMSRPRTPRSGRARLPGRRRRSRRRSKARDCVPTETHPRSVPEAGARRPPQSG